MLSSRIKWVGLALVAPVLAVPAATASEAHVAGSSAKLMTTIAATAPGQGAERGQYHPLPPAQEAAAQAAVPSRYPHHLSSRLTALLQERRGVSRSATTALPPATGPGSILRAADGRVLVIIRFAHYSSSRIRAVTRAGADVTERTPNLRRVTAAVAPADLVGVGEVPGVQYVGDIAAPMINDLATASTSSKAPAGGRLAAVNSGTCDTTVSEGDSLLHASDERTSRQVDGSGVTVGLLSDSFATVANPATTAAQDAVADNLPGTGNTCGHTTPVNVLQDYTGGEDEGRGMAQTVHDLAPGADLAFATADTGVDGFASNIKSLATAGSSVIVDDVTYFSEPMYQEGPISQAVDAVRAKGADYFSSAANNSLSFNGHQVGSYEAVDGYRPTACPALIAAKGEADCHNFDATPGDTPDPTYDFTAKSAVPYVALLNWAEPWYGGVNTDLDLYLINNTTNTIAYSSASQDSGATGSQEAWELIYKTLSTGKSYSMVVARKSAVAPASTPRFKIVLLENGYQPYSSLQYQTPTGTDVMGPTAFGHNDGPQAMGVGASDVTVSPSALNSYSSYGPVTLLFGPTGTPGASAAPLATPTVISKPDITASDCVRNSFFGYQDSQKTWRFCGTSDAAPHAAAAAALLKQQVPTATPEQINQALVSTAHPLSNATAAQQGAGLIDVKAAGDALAGTTSTISSDPITPTYGDDVQLTVHVTSSDATTPTGQVSVTVDSGTPQTAALTNGQATVDLGTLHAGTHPVQLSYASDGTHPSTSSSTSVVVAKAGQAITALSTPPANPALGSTYTPTATGGASGNPVTFSVDGATTNQACSIANGVVSFAHAGSCVLDADQAGTTDYQAATTVKQTIAVPQQGQTITFPASGPTTSTIGSSYTPAPTGGASGNPVVVAVDQATTNGACTVANGVVSLAHAGSCVIDADQAGNADYAAGHQQQSFTVAQTPQAITFTSTPPSPGHVGSSYTASATGGATQNAVVFTVDPSSTSGACSVAGAVVSLTGAGTCVVDANQAGDADHSAAPQAQQQIAVGRNAQAITFTPTPPAPAQVGGSYAPQANGGGSGQPVTYRVDPSTASACHLENGVVRLDHVGSCVIDADQAGNAAYSDAPTAQQTIVVQQAAQVVRITSTAPTSPTLGDTYPLTATGGASGQPVTFSTTSSACTIAGSTVTFRHAGACQVRADQAGNADYAAATPDSQTVTVAKAPTQTAVDVHKHKIVITVSSLDLPSQRPTGSVTVTIGKKTRTAHLTQGHVVVRTSVPARKIVKAAYAGDSDHNASSGRGTR